jgi:hypothetical protein
MTVGCWATERSRACSWLSVSRTESTKVRRVKHVLTPGITCWMTDPSTESPKGRRVERVLTPGSYLAQTDLDNLCARWSTALPWLPSVPTHSRGGVTLSTTAVETNEDMSDSKLTLFPIQLTVRDPFVNLDLPRPCHLVTVTDTRKVSC